MDTQERIKYLRKKIIYHDELYYNHNTSKISDIEYDKLVKELSILEQQNYIPAKTLPGFVAVDCNQVKHLSKMLSLSNTYSNHEIIKWYKMLERRFCNENIEIICEPKIDGVGISLIYINGVLHSGSTRGTGTIGEDITKNVLTIKNIPHKLLVCSPPKIFELRGEVYMNKFEFAKLNEQATFANARNATSGALRHKNYKVTASRNLNFFVHTFSKLIDGPFIDTQFKFFQFCQLCGFNLQNNLHICHSINDILVYVNYMIEQRNSLSYTIDGLVLKLNCFKKQKSLGCTTRHPRWAIAFKFIAQQTITTIKKICVQVGRNGTLTPLAILEQSILAGVTISKATLHNFNEIKRLNVNEGDVVLIKRAGDVIPKIMKLIKKQTNDFFKPPQHCPACYKTINVVHNKYICVNPQCPAQLQRHLLHFVSRKAMNIKGIGKIFIVRLIQKKKLMTIADIYFLTYSDLINLNIFKEKKVNTLLRAIHESKKQPLRKLLFALGIQCLGETSSEIVAKHFKNINALLNANISDFKQITNIGNVTALSLQQFFQNKAVRQIIDKLIYVGVNTLEYT
ncbi:MAG: NAD-dependent DNA ligase LigA [Endomicrobium sp.]|jgi:DNA ligase (NAD+)|nr:NAD-dependent DNA ligase LigA [Endomicrobium sp.]